VSDPKIRLATRGDADTVASLIVAFRDYYGEALPPGEEILSVVDELLADQRTEFLLAGQPAIGVAQLRFRLSVWTGTDDAWLEDLFVLEEERGTGAGRALAEASLERARARGCRRIQLDANERNEPAVRLYESLGFTCVRPDRWDGGRDLYWTLRL
jgi:GNAT superfamily N-acetyltransferase